MRRKKFFKVALTLTMAFSILSTHIVKVVKAADREKTEIELLADDGNSVLTKTSHIDDNENEIIENKLVVIKDCMVTYNAVNISDNIADINVTISNLSNNIISKWYLIYNSSAHIENLNNAEIIMDKDVHYLKYSANNEIIPANSEITFSMTISFEDTYIQPNDFRVYSKISKESISEGSSYFECNDTISYDLNNQTYQLNMSETEPVEYNTWKEISQKSEDSQNESKETKFFDAIILKVFNEEVTLIQVTDDIVSNDGDKIVYKAGGYIYIDTDKLPEGSVSGTEITVEYDDLGIYDPPQLYGDSLYSIVKKARDKEEGAIFDLQESDDKDNFDDSKHCFLHAVVLKIFTNSALIWTEDFDSGLGAGGTEFLISNQWLPEGSGAGSEIIIDYSGSMTQGSPQQLKHIYSVNKKDVIQDKDKNDTKKKPLKFVSTSLTIEEGKKKKIKITSKVDKNIIYTSKNKAVASVSKDGWVTAKKKGKTAIIVKTNGKTKEIEVKVKRKKG